MFRVHFFYFNSFFSNRFLSLEIGMDSKNPLVLYSSSSEDEDQLNEKDDEEDQKELKIENHNHKNKN